MSTIKNQIKSYTSSSLRKDLNNYFVYLGGVSGGSTVTDGTDISVVSRITKDETCVVVPRINWSPRDYTPYFFGSSGVNTYCYNDVSDIVYLCVGKNQPTGLLNGEINSTYEPTHTYGVQTYSDGYSWLALYRVDLELSKFLTETVLPVSNLDDYPVETNSGTYVTKYSSICGDSPGVTGECYFYYTKVTKDPTGATVYQINDVVTGIGPLNWECSKCHEFGESLGFKTKHIKSNSSFSEIQRIPTDTLKNKISSNNLDVNERYYIHYKNYEYQTNLQNAITSLHLDVSNLTLDQRIVPTQNPTVTILDALGLGATARIETYYDIPRNTFIANGITLLTSGSNYINPSFKVTGGSVALSRAIKAVIIPDIKDPSSFLPTPKVSVVKNISKNQLDSAFSTEQTIFSHIGIIKNVVDVNGIDPVVSSIPNQPIIGRTTSKIRLLPNNITLPGGGVASSSLTLDTSDVFIENAGLSGEGGKIIIKTTDDTADSADYTSKIVSSVIGATGAISILEVAGADELSFELISTATVVEVNDIEYTVESISNPTHKTDNVQYITTKALDTYIVFDKTTGTDSSAKLTFLL